jgi:hypothetical protein
MITDRAIAPIYLLPYVSFGPLITLMRVCFTPQQARHRRHGLR